MYLKNFLYKLQSTFSPSDTAQIIALLKRDELIWKQFHDLDFQENYLGFAGSDKSRWSPGSFGLYMLDPELRIESFVNCEFESLDPGLHSGSNEAYQVICHDAQSPRTLEAAAMLSFALLGFYKKSGSWDGLYAFLTAEGKIEPERAAQIWKTPMACLFGWVQDTTGLLKALMHTCPITLYTSWISHILFTYLTDKDQQVNAFSEMITGLSLSEKIYWLKSLNVQGEKDIVRLLGQRLVAQENDDAEFDDNLDEYSPDEIIQEVQNLQNRAVLYLFAGNPVIANQIFNQAMDCMNYGFDGLQIQIAESLVQSNAEETVILEEVIQNIPESERLQEELARVLWDTPEYSQLLENLPEDIEHPVILIKKAEILDHLGEHQQAVETARDAFESLLENLEQNKVEFYPDYANGWDPIAIIDILANLDLNTEALQLCNILLKERPADLALIERAGQLLEKLRNDEQALEYAQMERLLIPDDVEKQRRYAYLLENSGDWANAFTERKQVLEDLEYPKIEDRSAYAGTALKLERYADAAEACEDILQENENHGLGNLLMGKAQLGMGSQQKAVKYLSNATIMTPDAPEAWLLLAETYQNMGQHKNALETLQTAVLTAPDSADVNFALGDAYLKNGSFSESLPFLRKAATLNPASLDIAIELTETLKTLGYISDAETFLKEARQKWPRDIRLAYLTAEILLAVGKREEALPALEVSISGTQTSINRLMLYINTLLENKNPLLVYNSTVDHVRLSKALEALNRALEIEPGNTSCQLLQAEVLGALGEHTTAFEIFRLLMENSDLREGSSGWRIEGGFGLVAFRMGQVETALAALQSAVQGCPDNLDLHRFMTDAYLDADLKKEALQTANLALKMAPDNLEMLSWFSSISVSLGERDEAVRALRCATQLAPDRPELWLKLARLEWQSGDFGAARATLQTLILLDCISTEYLRHAASIYNQMSDPRMASHCLERALEMEEAPAHQMRIEIAYLKMQLGKYQEALNNLKPVLDQFEQMAYLHVFQSDLLVSLDRSDAALACLEHALRLIGINLDQPILSIDTQNFEPILPPNWAEELQKESSIHTRFALLYRSMNQLDVALAHSEQALESSSDSISLRYFAADMAYSLLETQKAAELSLTPLDSDNDFPFEPNREVEEEFEACIALICLRAEIAFESGEEILAGRLTHQAMEVSPDNPRVMALQSRLLARWGDYDTAHDYFIRAMSRYQHGAELKGTGSLVADVESYEPLHDFIERWQLWMSAAAIELFRWDEALRFMEEYIQTNYEPRAFLQLAKILTVQAERLRICSELGCISHAPLECALSEESEDKFDDMLARAEEISNSIEIERWKVRGRVVFSPTVDNVRRLTELVSNPEDNQHIVAALRWIGNSAGAIQMANRAKDNPGVMMQLALCCLDEESEDAITTAAKVVSAMPNNPLSHALMAILSGNLKRWELAFQSIEAALSFWPDEPEWHAMAAKYALQLNDLENAISHLEQAYELDVTQPDYALALGGAYLDQNRYAQAVEVLNKAVHLNPNSAEGWFHLAQAYRQTGNLMKSMECADRASSLDSKMIEPLLLSGEIALEMGRLNNALIYAKNALKRNSQNQDAILFIVKVLKAQDELKKALRVIEKSLTSIDPRPEILLEQAKLVLKLEGSVKALPLIEKLGETDEEDAEILGLLANTQFECGDCENAERNAMKSLQRDAEQADVNLLVGKIKHKLGQLDQAIHHLSEAIRISPSMADAYLDLAQTYLERREETKALQVYQKAAKVFPDDHRPYYQAGIILREQKDYVEAETMFRRAVELAPNDINIRRQLGAIVALNLVHNSQEVKTYL